MDNRNTTGARGTVNGRSIAAGLVEDWNLLEYGVEVHLGDDTVRTYRVRAKTMREAVHIAKNVAQNQIWATLVDPANVVDFDDTLSKEDIR